MLSTEGITEEDVFKDEEDFHIYLRTIKKFKEKHDFKFYGYCLMNNHMLF